MKLITLLFVVLWSTLSLAEVEVTIAHQTYKYETNPRLVEVLRPVALKQNWYWASASVFNLDSTNIDQLRDQAIDKLALLAKHDLASRSDYQNVIDQIKSWQLATRMASNLDYEIARIRADKNPAFTDGNYFISLSTRPKHIYVNGAVTKQTSLVFEENSCVAHYIKQVSVLDIASNDFIYVIHPNGKINKVGIAYWNKKCQMIMPGSQVYVPLSEGFIFSDTIKINESVANLLSNRILNK